MGGHHHQQQHHHHHNRTNEGSISKPGGIIAGGMASAAESAVTPRSPTNSSNTRIATVSEMPDATPFGGMTTSHLGSEPNLSEATDNAVLLGVAAASHHSIPPPTTATSQRDSIMISGMHDEDNDDSDEDTPRGEKRAGRRKIRIEYIEDKSRRHITFSKRKAGIMKKAYELSTLTGTQVLLLVASETGHVYTFATPKLQPLITKPEGKNLIQACLNAPDLPNSEYGNQNAGNYDSGDENGRENYEDRPGVGGGGGSQTAGMPVNYAAAMAGLAGFQYPTGPGNSSASAAFLNAAHYPAYAAQYNAALAAGYWPGATTAATQNIQTPSKTSVTDRSGGHTTQSGSVCVEATSPVKGSKSQP